MKYLRGNATQDVVFFEDILELYHKTFGIDGWPREPLYLKPLKQDQELGEIGDATDRTIAYVRLDVRDRLAEDIAPYAERCRRSQAGFLREAAPRLDDAPILQCLERLERGPPKPYAETTKRQMEMYAEQPQPRPIPCGPPGHHLKLIYTGPGGVTWEAHPKPEAGELVTLPPYGFEVSFHGWSVVMKREQLARFREQLDHAIRELERREAARCGVCKGHGLTFGADFGHERSSTSWGQCPECKGRGHFAG